MKTIALILALSFAALAQQHIKRDLNSQETAVNGITWKSYSAQMRLGYVVGFLEGIPNGVVGFGKLTDNPIDVDPLDKISGALCPEALTNEDVVKALDRFYQDPLNARITVVSAMMYIATLDHGWNDLAAHMLRDARQISGAYSKEKNQ
jgi:hypothetical protein